MNLHLLAHFVAQGSLIQINEMTRFCDSILMRNHVRFAIVTRLASHGAPDCQYGARLRPQQGCTRSIPVS